MKVLEVEEIGEVDADVCDDDEYVENDPFFSIPFFNISTIHWIDRCHVDDDAHDQKHIDHLYDDWGYVQVDDEHDPGDDEHEDEDTEVHMSIFFDVIFILEYGIAGKWEGVTKYGTSKGDEGTEGPEDMFGM